MNILAVHGSPRAKGNTDYLLDQLLGEIAAQAAPGEPAVKHVYAARLKARPCIACGGCDKTGLCIIKDEMQEVYAMVREADLLLIGSPVYFASVSAHLKGVIDRFQAAWVAKYELGQPWLPPGNGRRAALLCVGGMKAERHYRQSRSVVAAWLATLNWEFTTGLWFPGVDRRGEAVAIPGLAETIAATAQRLLAPAAAPGDGGTSHSESC